MFLTHRMNHWSMWDFCETRLKQNLNHRQDNDSTSAVAIKFGWMSVTHFTAESLSSFLFIYGFKLSWLLSTFIPRNVKMRMITIDKHDIIGQHHHRMNVGGWVIQSFLLRLLFQFSKVQLFCKTTLSVKCLPYLIITWDLEFQTQKF